MLTATQAERFKSENIDANLLTKLFLLPRTVSREQGVGGSNPLAPTSLFNKLKLIGANAGCLRRNLGVIDCTGWTFPLRTKLGLDCPS
jgi:hypothetical protein